MRWFPLRSSVESTKALARMQYNEKDYKKAEKSLQKLRKMGNENHWANDVLARLFMNTGRHEQAIPLWQENLNTSDNHPREISYLINCYRVTKRYQEGLNLASNSILTQINDEIIWNL